MWPGIWNLLGTVLLFHFSKGFQDCGDINLSGSVIPLGASITASCTINPTCSSLLGETKRVVWKLDRELLPEGWQQQREDGTLRSNITLLHLNRTHSILSCCLLLEKTPQIIAQAELKAGYPPQPPSNLSCLMNLTTNVLTCQWKPGPRTHLPTTFTLKSYKNKVSDQSREEPISDCVAKDGENQCSIHRNQLQLYQKTDIWVKAENVLGVAESPHLCIKPMDVVKPEPPILQAAKIRIGPSSLPQPGCLQLQWEKDWQSKHLKQTCELRYQQPGELSWVLVSPFLDPNLQQEGQSDLCGLLYATRYILQMRCIRWFLRGQWSDWSPSLELTTRELPPKVRLDVWWRRRVQKLDTTMMDIQLLWKPVPTKENSSRIQGYLVFPSPSRQDKESQPLCNTTELSCAFQLSVKAQKVKLTAYNSAGESPPTTIFFWECQDEGTSLLSIHTSAPDAHSIWVGWEHSLVQPLPRAYVIEWCLAPALQEGDCNGNWKMESNGNSTGTLLDDNIMPFQLYKITVSPLYHGTRGCPQNIYAYSQEKALSHAPKLKLRHIGHTWAKLEWEPGVPELGKSPITQYTVFWTNTQDKEFSTTLNASSRSFTLCDLVPASMYHVHLLASNQAGGINSTYLTLMTTALEKDINVFLILISLFCVMIFFILTLVCLYKNHKMKNQLWPNVPDPAHSSLGKWIPTILSGETIHLSILRDSAMPPVSKIIVLKEEEKKLPPQTMGPEEEATKNLPHLVQAYILQEDPFLPEPHPSSKGPIQYGKVMGNQGYQRQHGSPAGLYLRTDSTQPLLADLTPSPKDYENMWFQRSPSGSRVSSSQGFPEDDSAFFPHCPQEPLLDFPLLQGLRIEGAEGLGSI